MIGDLKRFINKIQNSDDTVKKRWLVVFVSVSVMAVVALWGVYLKTTVVTVAVPDNLAVEERPGVIDVFKAGLSVVRDKTATGLANSFVYFKGKVESKNQLTIEGGSRNFVLQSLEKLPQRELP